MMNMLIKLDEDKIKRDGKYAVKELWNEIDKIFAEYRFTKEVQSDGSVMYNGVPNGDNFNGCSCARIILRHKAWFGCYCIKWIWYDNDDDESLPYQDYDLLAKQRKTNPLFQNV